MEHSGKFVDTREERNKMDMVSIQRATEQDIGVLISLYAEVYAQQDEPHPLVVPHRYGHLQSLIVSESARKQGLGRLLVEAAHDWAKERGVTEMQLDIWEFEAGPLHFYEHLGYRTLKRHLVLDLG